MLELTIDVSQIQGAAEALRQFSERLKAHMRTAMQFSLDEVLKHAMDAVHVRTGTLRRSINTSRPIEVGTGFEGKIGTNLSYAAMEEFGFTGLQNVRAHIRSSCFGRSTRPFTVPAHSRNINRQEHPYLRPALAMSIDAIQGFHEKAVADTAAEMNVA